MNKRLSLLALALGLACAPALAAELVVVNFDQGTGAGLDDPTPAAPEGGNPGLSVGEQRRIVYQYAAEMWGAILDSDVPVYVGARFTPLTCTVNSAVLGSAGTTQVFRGSFNPVYPFPDAWHHVALTEALIGFDANPGTVDINSNFNSRLNGDPACLGGRGWYYGLDGQTPPGDINFLNVVMHEIAHGLGFSGFTSVTTGAPFSGYTDIYSLNVFNNTLGKQYPLMTNTERAASMRDNGNTVWTGPNVTAAAAQVLEPRMAVRITAPSAARGLLEAGRSTLGPVAEYYNFRGKVVVANDGAGTTTDACEPLANAAAAKGNIVLLDRGNCTFNQKVLNAQAAGATAVLIADNTVAPTLAPGGVEPGVTIPVLGLRQADGAAIKAATGVTLYAQQHPTLRDGADAAGRARLYAPTTVAQGSTFSHFDTALNPNALMEPSITTTLRGELDVDLTKALFADIGWPINTSGARVLGCPTGIPTVDPTGVAAGAAVEANAEICASYSSNQNGFRSCVVKHAEKLVAARLLTKDEGARVLYCAYTAYGQNAR